MNSASRTFAMSHGINDLSTAIDAVPASEILGIGGLHRLGIHNDSSAIKFQTGNFFQKLQLLLPECLHDHVNLERELGSRNKTRRAPSALIRRPKFGFDTDKPYGPPTRVGNDSHRRGLPDEGHAIGLCEFVRIVERRHRFATAAVNHIDDLCSQPPRRSCDIDCGIAAANHRHARSDLHMLESVRLGSLDERERINDAANALILDVQLFRGPEANADEDRLKLAIKLRQRNIFSDHHSRPNLDPEFANHFNLADRIGCAHLVCRNAISIQTAGIRFRLVDHSRISQLAEFDSTREARRAGPDQSDTMPVRRTRFENLNLAIEYVINCVSLQSANLDRLLAFGVQNARAFTEYRSGTYASAAVPEHVGGENGSCRTGQVVSDDLPNELWNVDLSRTSFNAGSVVAEQTTRGRFQSQRRRQRRIDIGKVLFNLLRSEFGARMHENTSLPLDGWKVLGA